MPTNPAEDSLRRAMGSELPVEVFLTGGHELHDREFQRAQTMRIGKHQYPVISPEDLVLRKLVNLRLRRSERDVQDLLGILVDQRGALDVAYIREHAGVHRVGKAFERFWKEAQRHREAGT